MEHMEDVKTKSIKELREKSGMGMMDCNKALIIFDNNINQAYEYLFMRGLAVCRRKLNGVRWVNQDYIDWVKDNIK